MSARLQIIDIGHRGYSLDRALSELEAAVSDCVFGGKTRAIKVIHGHGTGALKRGVREWCEDQTGRFQAVIIGLLGQDGILDPVIVSSYMFLEDESAETTVDNMIAKVR